MCIEDSNFWCISVKENLENEDSLGCELPFFNGMIGVFSCTYQRRFMVCYIMGRVIIMVRYEIYEKTEILVQQTSLEEKILMIPVCHDVVL